ncbi:hypothetical protein GPECTOR_8g334 [Gonium pectorale]|uniref:Uncharacterized protein n=1 Tax=Gonium pectorale TaxID=33097 RepID=A0A150GT17_GONPE|nr:hypothetical protein GPECTOR_8g334 [Gonium pectorale]|eukprot:KXZ52961.1 hypothetical protein GPECTOR_8g334 [Gonium pectorale]
MWLEAAHGVFNTACTILLFSWYSRNPATGVSFWSVVGQKLVLTAINLHVCVSMPPATTIVAAPDDAVQVASGASYFSCALSPGNGDGLVGSRNASPASAFYGHSSSSGDGGAGAVSRWRLLAAAAAAQGCSEGGPAGYRPFIRHVTQVVKLRGCQPEQLGPGWEERLGEELAAQGLTLAGAYVRAGCIELLLEMVHVQFFDMAVAGGMGTGGNSITRSGSDATKLLADQVTGAKRRENGSSGGCSGGRGGSDVDGIMTALDDPVRLAAVLRALGLPAAALPATPPGGTELEVEGHELPLVQVLGTLHGPVPQSAQDVQAGPKPGGQPSGVAVAQPPISLSLRPRALLLPTQGSAAASGRLVLELTATGLPHATPPGQAAGGGGADAGSLLEVLVRSRNRYLPARVRAQATVEPCDEDGGGRGPERSDKAAVRFEVELEAEGLQAGLTMVDLRLGGQPLCALPLLLLPAGREDLAAELATMAEAASATVEVTDLGLVREAPEEAEAFRELVVDWTARQAHTMHTVEFLALASGLLRGGRDHCSLLSLTVWLLRFSASLVTAAGWLLLPPPAWRRLAATLVGPRYAADLATKVIVLFVGVPNLSSASFQLQGGLLAFEGVLQPAACLLSVASALALAPLHVLLNAARLGALALETGARAAAAADGAAGASSAARGLGGWPLTGRALLLAAQVEVVALATTLACNVYLRLGCRRGRERLAKRQQGERSARSKTE